MCSMYYVSLNISCALFITGNIIPYSLQVGSRFYYYCDTCGESYIDQLDELGKRDFVTLYSKRLHQKNNETLSQGDDTLLEQATSEETSASQQDQGISQEDDMIYNEDMSVEQTLSADRTTTREHGTDHVEHDVLNEAQGNDALQGQNRAKEDDLSQVQEHGASQRCDTQQVGNQSKLCRQDTSEDSCCQVSSIGADSNWDCSMVSSALDAALAQDVPTTLKVTSTCTNSVSRQSTPVLPLHGKRTNLNSPSQHPMSQVTGSTITSSTLCNDHLASDACNDSQCTDILETATNSNKSSGEASRENSATGELPGENTVSADGTNQSVCRARRKKPYDIDRLPSHHRVCRHQGRLVM